MNKKELVDQLVKEILNEVAVRVRFMVREEVELNARSTIKKILKEQMNIQPTERILTESPRGSKQKRVETGDPRVDSILESVQISEEEEMAGAFALPGISSLQEQAARPAVSHKLKPAEKVDFNPAVHDPSKLDWSTVVDRIDAKSKK